MRAAQFRRIVLGLSDVVEGAHMGHADFRAGRRIFASLSADESTASVRLAPADQARFLEQHRGSFEPAAGAWGRQGWTVIRLAAADAETAGEAATLAWQLHAAAPAPGRRKPAAAAVKQARGTSPVDAYLASASATVRPILEKIRALVRKEAPEAEEKISYRMPAFFLGGRVLLYYAPFKAHIGLFPPVSGDAALMKALAKYAGPKGNLRLPLDSPIPYPLIRRIVRTRIKALQD